MFTRKNLISILTLAIVALALPLGVTFVRQRQVLLSHASSQVISYLSSNGSPLPTDAQGQPVSTSLAVKVVLNAPTPNSTVAPSLSATPDQSAHGPMAYQALITADGQHAFRRACAYNPQGLGQLGTGFSGGPCLFVGGDTAETVDQSVWPNVGGKITNQFLTTYQVNGQWRFFQILVGADKVTTFQRDCTFDPNNRLGPSVGLPADCPWQGPNTVNDARYGGRVLSQNVVFWTKPDGSNWAYQAIITADGKHAFRRWCPYSVNGLGNLGSGFDGGPCPFISGNTAETVDQSVWPAVGGSITNQYLTTYQINNQWHAYQILVGADGVTTFQRDCTFDPSDPKGPGALPNSCQFKGPLTVNDAAYGGKLTAQNLVFWMKP